MTKADSVPTCELQLRVVPRQVHQVHGAGLHQLHALRVVRGAAVRPVLRRRRVHLLPRRLLPLLGEI